MECGSTPWGCLVGQLAPPFPPGTLGRAIDEKEQLLFRSSTFDFDYNFFPDELLSWSGTARVMMRDFDASKWVIEVFLFLSPTHTSSMKRDIWQDRYNPRNTKGLANGNRT